MLYLLVVFQLVNTLSPCGRIKLRIFEILGRRINIFIISLVLDGLKIEAFLGSS